MKRLLRFFSFLLISGPAAYADTNVTTYGVVDLGVVYNSNVGGSSLYRLNPGNLSGSRIGFRGTEDLGNGLSSVFVLESGFAADTGAMQQGGRLFGRQAYVGLQSSRLGTLTLGRQYPVFAYPIGGETAALRYGTSIMVHPLDLDFVAGTMRLNNSIVYESPNYDGLNYRAQYALGELAGDSTNNRAWSLGAGYKAGALRLQVGYAGLDRPDAANNQNGAVAADYQLVLPQWLRRIDANSAGRATASSASVAIGKQRTSAISAVYEQERWSVGFVGTHTRFDDIAMSNAADKSLNTSNGTLGQSVYELNGTYRFVPNSVTGFMLSYTKASLGLGTASLDPGWLHIGVANDYFLSKRTDIYTAIGYQRAKGAFNVAVMGQSIAASQSQVSIGMGIRHRF